MDVPLYSSLFPYSLNKSFGAFGVGKNSSDLLERNHLILHLFHKLYNELEIVFANIRV